MSDWRPEINSNGEEYKCKLCQNKLFGGIATDTRFWNCRSQHYSIFVKNNKITQESLVNYGVQLCIEYDQLSDDKMSARIIISPFSDVRSNLILSSEEQAIWENWVQNGNISGIKLSDDFEGLTEENIHYWYNRLPIFRIFS